MSVVENPIGESVERGLMARVLVLGRIWGELAVPPPYQRTRFTKFDLQFPSTLRFPGETARMRTRCGYRRAVVTHQIEVRVIGPANAGERVHAIDRTIPPATSEIIQVAAEEAPRLRELLDDQRPAYERPRTQAPREG